MQSQTHLTPLPTSMQTQVSSQCTLKTTRKGGGSGNQISHIILDFSVDDLNPTSKTRREGGMQARNHLTPLPAVMETRLFAGILPSKIKGKVGLKHSLTLRPPPPSYRGGCGSHPTFKTRRECGMQAIAHIPPLSTILCMRFCFHPTFKIRRKAGMRARNHLTSSSTIMQRRVWLTSYLHN